MRNSTWERGMDRELFDAYHNGDIPPVRLLNRLFRGPRILFGYYQGGLIVEYLAREHGFDKVVDMLRLYGAGWWQELIRLQDQLEDVWQSPTWRYFGGVHQLTRNLRGSGQASS